MPRDNQAVKEILDQNPFLRIRQGASNPSRIVVKGSKGAGHVTVQVVKRHTSAANTAAGQGTLRTAR